MRRYAPLILGLLLLAAVAVVGFKQRRYHAETEPVASAPLASASTTPSTSLSAEVPPDAAPDPEPETLDPLATGSDYSRWPDGGVVPRLPATAPKEVVFGVILVAYSGAELAPKGAPPREVALRRAAELIPKAVQDFTEAAKLGDRGSNANAGQIPRGVLEPALEYVLFTLSPGAVSPEPIDTPRGYWVAKRIK